MACTEKQWSFLQSLGYDGNKPDSIAEASGLIDQRAGKPKKLSSVSKPVLTSKEVEEVKMQTRRILEIRKLIADDCDLRGAELGQLINLVMGAI